MPWESVLAPDVGDELFTSEPFPVTWTNRWDAVITRVDLAYSTDSGSNWSSWQDDIDYTDQDSVNVAMWQPDDDAVSDQFRIRLRFHSTSGLGYDDSNGDAIVYPVRARFLDVTGDGLDSFDGQPAAIVPIAADNDTSGIDVIVSIGSATGGAEGKMFINSSNYGGDLGFDDDTDDYLPDQLLEVGFGAMAVADYDGDGDEDVFACRPDDQTSQLFRNHAGVFASANDTVLAGVYRGLLAYARCACWIDADHDGDLDLYVGRGDGTEAKRDLLLIYDSAAETFADVGAASGLVDSQAPVATATVAWGDLDGDGRWEVIKAGTSDTQVFRQVAVDSFAIVAGALPSELPAGSVQALRLADLDRDNDLDLLVVRAGMEIGDVGYEISFAPSYVCYNDGGEFVSAEALPTSGEAVIEGYPLDYDLDGWMDILLPNTADASRPALLANLQGIDVWYPAMSGSYPPFKDLAAAAGLGSADLVQGALTADFNRDGDPDLFLGHADRSAGTLYTNTRPDSTQAPASHWLSIRLVSPIRSQPFAATVTIETTSHDPLGSQIIDAGGTSRSQQLRQVNFGLADHDEAVIATVYWPGWSDATAPSLC